MSNGTMSLQLCYGWAVAEDGQREGRKCRRLAGRAERRRGGGLQRRGAAGDGRRRSVHCTAALYTLVSYSYDAATISGTPLRFAFFFALA